MRLTASRVIHRPADEVAEFFFDATNNPRWQRGMQSCEWATPGPIGVGSEYVQVASFLGRTISSRFEVTDHTPGRSITIRTIESTFPIEVTRAVEPLDTGSSRVTADISGSPGGVFRLLAPVVRRLAQRSVDRDYDRLVALLD
jgi:carbon monoxide dehydrogenase subunit G